MRRPFIMQKLKRIVIKEELVALCEGDFNEALVLDQLIFWQGIINENDREIQEQINRKLKLELDIGSLENKLRHGWFWKTANELAEEIMNYKSRRVINRTLTSLEDKKFIQSKENMRGKWDNTKSYKVNLEYIQQELNKLGYALEGYSLNHLETPSNPKGQNVHSEGQNVHSEGQNVHSEGQNVQTVSVSNFSNHTSENNALDIYQSKKEEIAKIELPIKIKETCYKFMDRLIDDHINISDIKTQFNTYKLLIKYESEEEYQDFFVTYLERVLCATKGSIRSIKSLIDTAVKQDFQEGSITINRNPNVKQEVLPEWFTKQKEQENSDSQESSLENEQAEEVDPEHIQQEKDEILKSIKARSQKRKQESLT